MDSSSKLIPNDIIAQCDAAINVLNEDNQALLTSVLNIDSFMMDKSIQASSFDSMRSQMSNFFTVINLLRSANIADIDDFQKLKGMVGSEEIDGAKLLEQLEEAKRQKALSVASLNEITSAAKNTNNTTKEYSQNTIRNYEQLIEYDKKIITEIQEKIDFYDKVDAESGSLFETGANIRQSVKAALGEIAKSTISGGTYKVPSFDKIANTMLTLNINAKTYIASNTFVSRDPNSLNIDYDISVLSQNLRSGAEEDGENNQVDDRTGRIKQLLKNYDTDIVCFQECTKEWKKALTFMLNPFEYKCVYQYNSKNLCNPIYVKRDKFEVLDSGSIQVSDEYITKKGKVAESRVATWVKVKDKKTGETMVMMNTHLACDKELQEQSSQIMMDKLKEINADNYLICGDFNYAANENKDAYNIMTQNGAKDMAVASKEEGLQGKNDATFHDFGKEKLSDRKRIDYFIGSEGLNSDYYSVIDDTYNGEYVSDHNGILNYVSFKNKK